MTVKVKVKGNPGLKKMPDILDTKHRSKVDGGADDKALPLWRQIFELGKTGGDVKLGTLQFKSTESGLQLSPDSSQSPLFEYRGSKLKNWLAVGGTTAEVLENLKYTFDRYSLNMDEIEISDITVETKKLYTSLKDKKGEAGMQAHFKLKTAEGPLELKFDSGKKNLGVSLGRFNLYFSNDKNPEGAKGTEKAEQPPEAAETSKGIPQDGADAPQEPGATAGASAKFSYKSIRQKPEARLRLAEEYVRKHANVKDARLRDDVLDTAVESLSEDFATDPRVIGFREKYDAATDKARGYKEFTSELRDMLDADGKFNKFVDAVGDTALLLNQIGTLSKSKELRSIAAAVTTATHVMAGMKDISNAISAISAAGKLSMTSVVGMVSCMVNGIGAVIGAISIVTSLLGDDDDEGDSIGEAIMAMWQDMRAEFEDIRNRINALTDMVVQLDENAQKRFKVMMSALEFSHTELASKLDRLAHATGVGFEQLKNSLGGYFKHAALLQLHAVHNQISTRVHENITLDDVSTWAATILGVASTFASPQYNGDTRDETGALVETAASMTSRLLRIHAPQVQQDQNLPLGFVQALANEILPGSAGTGSGVINPQHWFQVQEAYLALVDFYSERILRQPYIADGYIRGLKKLLDQAKDTEKFLTALKSEAFWSVAVSAYQRRFDAVRDAIIAEQPSVLPGRQPFPFQWDITKSVDQNLHAFAHGPGAANYTLWLERASPLGPHKWVSLKAVRDDRLVDSPHMGQPGRHVPGGDVNLVLQQRQMDELLGDGTFKARMESVLKHPHTKLLFAYLDARPGVAYNILNIGTDVHEWDFVADIAMTVIVQSTPHTLPFVQGSLYRHCNPFHIAGDGSIISFAFSRRRCDGWGGRIEEFAHRTPTQIFGFRYNEKSDFYEHSSNILQAHLLEPACASAAQKLTGMKGSSERVLVHEEALRLAHAQIVSILRLLDSSAKVSLELPPAAAELVQSLRDLSSSHTCASLGAVLAKSTNLQRSTSNGPLSQKHWQAFLTDYVGSNFIDFGAADLARQIEAGFAENPLLKKLQHAQVQIKKLIDKLDPAANGAEGESLIESAMKVMEKHFYRLDDTLAAMQTHLSTIAALEDASGAEALQELVDTAEAVAKDVAELFQVEVAEEKAAESTPDEPPHSAPEGPKLPSRLQQLCADKAADVAEVNAELEVLSRGVMSAYWANATDPQAHPLVLATRNGRDDLVKVLLQHDPPVSDELFAAISVQEHPHLDSRAHLLCVAQVHFYRSMQELGEVMSERGVGFGRMLAILHEGLTHLLQSPAGIEHAVIFNGPSKNGKSTFINVLNGIVYEIDKDILEEYGFIHLRAVHADLERPAQEYVRSSSSSRSETTFPTIVPGTPAADGASPNPVWVDMAGLSDTRGLTYSIAESILAEFLGKIVLRSVKMLVLVIKEGQLGANKKDVLDAVSALGRLFDSEATLKQHVLLVVNAASEHFTEKHAARTIAELRAAHEHESTPETNAALSVLSDPAQIMVVRGIPGKDFRESLHKRLDSVQSAPVEKLRFDRFGSDSQAFRVLLNQLRKYHSGHLALLQQGINALAGAAADDIGNFCRPVQAWHYDVERLRNVKALPEELELQKETTLAQMKELVTVSGKVEDLCVAVLDALDRYAPAGAPAEHLEVLRAMVVASESFLRVIDDMLARGKPDGTYTWSTPPEEAPPSATDSSQPTNPDVNATVDDFVEGGPGGSAEINEEGVGSAWPFPGAAATRFPQRDSYSAKSALEWRWESVYVPLMVLFRPLREAALRLGQAFAAGRNELPSAGVQHAQVQTTTFNGVPQPACVYDWRSPVMAALLPRTTVLGESSASGHLLPRCERQQIEFSMGNDSTLRVEQDGDAVLPSIAGALGSKDMTLLVAECGYLAKSGLVAFLLALLRPVLSKVGRMHDAATERACGVANLLLVAVLYSLQTAAFHVILLLALTGVSALLRASSSSTTLSVGKLLSDHIGSVVFSASLLFYLHKSSQVGASGSVLLRVLYFAVQCAASNLCHAAGKRLGRWCGEALTAPLRDGI